MTDAPKSTDEPEILDEDLEVVSMAGRILGTLQGRLDAATAAFNIAYQNGVHDELELAGYFTGHEAHADPQHATAGPYTADDRWLLDQRQATTEKPLADWERDLLAAEEQAHTEAFGTPTPPRPDDDPAVVRFHASDYVDKLTFSATPSWLLAALKAGVIKGVFKSEDYWYLEVRTPAGVVTAEPGDTISRHHDGGLLVRSPDGLCKTAAPDSVPQDDTDDLMGNLNTLQEAVEAGDLSFTEGKHPFEDAVLHEADKALLYQGQPARCAGSGQLFERPCPGCPDCAAAEAEEAHVQFETGSIPRRPGYSHNAA